MKTVFIFFAFALGTQPATATLKECQAMMKTADKVCKDDLGCKINYLEVSGAETVRTANSVVCRGEKNLVHGVKNKTNSRSRRARKVRF